MALHKVRDIGAFITSVNLFNPQVVTAGTTGESERAGPQVDLRTPGGDFGAHAMRSCKIVVHYNESLSTAETATVSWNLQHSSSTASTAFSDFDDTDGTTGQSASLTTASGAGVDQADFDLSTAKRYVRLQVTPTLSATATDTLDISAIGVFGGPDVVPASTS